MFDDVDASHYEIGGPHFTLPKEQQMTDDENKVPQPGDEFLFQDSEGEFQIGVIAEVNEVDEEDGLYPIKSRSGGEYRVYWSDNDDSWVDEGE